MTKVVDEYHRELNENGNPEDPIPGVHAVGVGMKVTVRALK